MEVFGSWPGDTEEAIEGIHDGEILARRSSDNDHVVNGRASLLGKSKCLTNSLTMVCYKVPDVREVAHWCALFVELPFMRLKRVTELVGNDRTNASVEFGH